MDVIYKLTSPSGKSYIGRTKDFDSRMADHKHNGIKGHHYALYRAIRKYGWDSFTVEILCKVDPMESSLIEEYYIEKYEAFTKGYNNIKGGEHGGDKWEGRYDSDEYREFVARMVESNQGENNGMFGKKHKESSRKLQKEKSKGRFSLPWYIERNGEEEGTRMYNERCKKLRERKLPKDKNGKFIKKS